MSLDLEFYRLVANLVPVLLIALAVERFGTSNPTDPRSVARHGVRGIVQLIVTETVALSVLAARQSNFVTDLVVITGLSFGLYYVASTLIDTVWDAHNPAVLPRGAPIPGRVSQGLDFLTMVVGLVTPMGLVVYFLASKLF